MSNSEDPVDVSGPDAEATQPLDSIKPAKEDLPFERFGVNSTT